MKSQSHATAAAAMTTITEVANHLSATLAKRPQRALRGHHAVAKRGGAMSMLEWDLLNLEIDAFCAQFKAARPDGRPRRVAPT